MFYLFSIQRKIDFKNLLKTMEKSGPLNLFYFFFFLMLRDWEEYDKYYGSGESSSDYDSESANSANSTEKDENSNSQH